MRGISHKQCGTEISLGNRTISSGRRASALALAFCAAVGVAVLATGETARSQVEYTLTPLGTLPGATQSIANGINDLGEVVGESFINSSGPDETAFLYDNGTMTAIVRGYAGAGGINNNGEVAGSIGDNGAFVWTAATGVQDIPMHSAGPINDSGEVAGRDSGINPAVYKNGQVIPLGSFGGSYGGGTGEAGGINQNGDVTGSSYLAGEGSIDHPFLYSNGQLHDLGTLGGQKAEGFALNNSDQVVGWSQTVNANIDAFLYSGGQMKDLGNLGGTFAVADGINDSGTIIGQSQTSGNAGYHAFVYNNGELSDLNTLITPASAIGWTLQSARGINKSGQIVGYGTVNGKTQAFLLTPTVVTETVNRTPVATLIHVFTPPPAQVVTLQNNTVQVTNTDPNQQGLLVYSNGQFSTSGTINRSVPTIVLTHGFASDPSMWNQFAQQYPSGVNIVAWNWGVDASLLAGLGFATSRTDHEGTMLGESLVAALGTAYNKQIHFFGHSLGNLVNASAVNLFEAQTHDNTKTQVTIFDDAEIANEFPATGQFTSK